MRGASGKRSDTENDRGNEPATFVSQEKLADELEGEDSRDGKGTDWQVGDAAALDLLEEYRRRLLGARYLRRGERASARRLARESYRAGLKVIQEKRRWQRGPRRPQKLRSQEDRRVAQHSRVNIGPR